MREASFLRKLWEGIRKRNWRKREYRQIARGFDSVWLRRGSAIAFVAMVVLLFLPGTMSWARDAFPWAIMGFTVLVMVYFVHLLFARLQCSLTEWTLLVLALGNVEGVLLSTPQVRQLGWMAVLTATLLAALILFGFAMGLAEARLLGVRKTLPRLMLIAANWLALPSPILLLGGLALWIGRSDSPQVVSPAMAAWAGPLSSAGLVGVVVLIVVSVLVRRRARLVLSNTSVAGSTS